MIIPLSLPFLIKGREGFVEELKTYRNALL